MSISFALPGSMRNTNQPHETAAPQLPGTASENSSITEFIGTGTIVTITGAPLQPSSGWIGLLAVHVLSEEVPATAMVAIDSDGGTCTVGVVVLEHATTNGRTKIEQYEAIFMKHAVVAREL